jgi:threonine synthase
MCRMTTSPLFDLRCSGCRAAYPAEGFPALCPACGKPWEPAFSAASGLRWHEPQAEATGLRRWAGTFGLSPEELPDRPISRAPGRLGNVWIAHQGSPPSGSYKELGAEVMVSAARRRGIGELFLDSSGNAGIAVARACSERGIRCTVLVPEHTPEIKKERSRRWGATVETIPGDRDATNRAAEEWSRRMTYAAPFYQPTFAMGVATLAWELHLALLALGESLPRRWLLPAGNGPLLLGLGLGLETLRRAGRIERLPALHAVQLAGYASLHPEGPGTAAAGSPRAAGIAIGNPPRRAAMRNLVESTGGDVTRVSDDEIAAARQRLAEAGWNADPTGAAAYAGWLARPDLQDEPCVVIITSREEPVER